MVTLTLCPYCGTGCQVVLNGEKNLGLVTGYKSSPVNKGRLCIKGYSGLSYSFSKERLTTPLIKRSGKFVKVTWEEAIDAAVRGLKDIRSKFGPDSVAFQSSAKCTNEENYLMQKIARLFGTNNIDHCARSCHSSTVVGLLNTLGAAAATGSIDSLSDSKTYFVIGSNTTEQHPIIGSKIVTEIARGKKLIVADPRKIKLAELADIFLQFRPGSDIALLNSMMFVILEREWFDRDFVDKRTEGFEEFKAEIEKYAPEITENITGIEPHLIEEAARIYSQNKPSALLYAMGITQHIHGTENVMDVSNLSLITGNIGKRGSGIFPLRGQNNVQGSSDMGALSDFYPGYIKSDSSQISKFEKIWNSSLPISKGLTLSEMFQAANEGKVKAIYVMGENPLITEAHLSSIERAVDNLDLFIVQDIFMTETAKHADIIFPASSTLEKEGTFTNTERRIQKVNKVYDPPGEAKADWWILQEVGKKLFGLGGYSTPKEIFEEIRKVIPNYSGASYDSIFPVGKQWPVTLENIEGTETLHERSFPIGRGKLIPISYRDPAEIPDESFPLILTTGRNYYHWHSGSMTMRTNTLSRESPEPYVEISISDAKRLNIRDQQLVNVESSHGSIRLKARITNSIPDGVIFIPFHFTEARVNYLVGEKLDPFSKIPEFKVVAARVIA